MSRFGTRPMVRASAAVIAIAAFGMTIGGCSQLYLDRRDSLALSAGDAIAANEAVQVIDPWPPRSANTNLVFNGQRMQAAAERYRSGTVVQPVDPMAPQLFTATPASPSNGNGASSGSGTPNTTLVIGAPAAAAAASP
jgi:hypothetical protein